jgi:hypothetical protein
MQCGHRPSAAPRVPVVARPHDRFVVLDRSGARGTEDDPRTRPRCSVATSTRSAASSVHSPARCTVRVESTCSGSQTSRASNPAPQRSSRSPMPSMRSWLARRASRGTCAGRVGRPKTVHALPRAAKLETSGRPRLRRDFDPELLLRGSRAARHGRAARLDASVVGEGQRHERARHEPRRHR